MPRTPRSYRLTAEHVATHGGECVALAPGAFSRPWRTYARRPDAGINGRLTAGNLSAFDPYESGLSIAIDEPDAPAVQVVVVAGPLMTHAGAPGPCEEWVDGHSAVADRLCAALRAGPVTLAIFESPGGAVAGAQSAIDRVLAVKAETGAKIIGYAPMAGSAAAWWALSVCDEVIVPRDGVVGAIGVRAQHNSIAGKLAQEGIAPTFSAWPDEGKVAGVEELPLSDLGKARMDALAAEAGAMFAASVCAGPVCVGAGLDPAGIAAMHAAAFTGAAAVKAGLASSVAPLQETMAYALAMASNGSNERMTAMADPENAPDPKDGDEDDLDGGMKPDGVCKSCEFKNPMGNHFCGQCGASMAPPRKDPADAPPDSDRAPSARVSTAGSVAAMLAEFSPGLRADASDIAVKAALAPVLGFARFALVTLGAADVSAAKGRLRAVAEDAAAGVEAKRSLKREREAAVTRERSDIFARLGAANLPDPDLAPGRLFVQKATADGRPLAPEINAKHPLAFMPIAELREYERAKLHNAGPERNPYEPSESAAAEQKSAAALPAVKNAPAVVAAVKSGIPEDVAARTYAHRFPEATR